MSNGIGAQIENVHKTSLDANIEFKCYNSDKFRKRNLIYSTS